LIRLNFWSGIPAAEKRITIPTLLTLMRLISVPCIVWSMIVLRWTVAFNLILFASLTDLLDGYIARQFNQQTWFGACLDPIADKVLIISVYAALAFVPSPLFTIPVWFLLLVLLKELLLVGSALLLYLYVGAFEVRPTGLGKLTMLVQVLFIIWVFACYFFGWVPVKTYYGVLGIVFVLVLSSLMQYAKIGFDYLKVRSL